MFIDARTIAQGKVLSTDVCIIGAGAAGITLAHEFVGAPFRVVLLESGGLDLEEDTQSLAEGESVGYPYPPLEATRLRLFGGTTKVWSGWCRPIDAMDFEARDWIPYSGWPFSKSHLDPYYKRAHPILQLPGPYIYDGPSWATKETPRLPFRDESVVTRVFQFSPPTRFGEVYRSEIEHANNITTYLHANVVEIETTSNANTATRARVACLTGNKFWIAAKVFLLAAGAIENARLLLLSNKTQKTGLGNQHDLVGRFFMERPHVESALWLPSDPFIPLALYQSHLAKNIKMRGVLSLSSEIQRREKLLNFVDMLYLAPMGNRIPIGVKSVRHILKAFRKGSVPDDFMDHLWNVITDIDEVASEAFNRVFKRKKGRPVDTIYMESRVEPSPNPDSRVTLSARKDRLGKNLVRLDWRFNPIDKRSIRRSHELLAQELGRAGIGRMKIKLSQDDNTWPSNMALYHHHMGTTRMDKDPKKGVVDENCRIHGVSNLFVAGPSAFPSAGASNPVMSIVALSIRLADHVKGLFR